ncbi:unnamed protein product, partial [Symbiodinium sp. CCMP2456]
VRVTRLEFRDVRENSNFRYHKENQELYDQEIFTKDQAKSTYLKVALRKANKVPQHLEGIHSPLVKVPQYLEGIHSPLVKVKHVVKSLVINMVKGLQLPMLTLDLVIARMERSGMAQLQAVMLKQMANDSEKDKSGSKSPEAVKPGTSTLPALPPVDPRSSAVDMMDWLEMITTPMQDLSDGSAEWWRRVRTAASEAYNTWAKASPVEKLVIQPPHEEELESGKWSRLNSRAASMILLALHDSVRQEMVQRRSTGSTCALIFRLLTIYQPGGQQEKVHILQSLQQPEAESTASRAVTALRTWARWLRRCRELGVTAPDPSLLARGLSTMTKQVLDKDMEVNFRTNLVRSTLLVDTTPSYDSVEKYYHHLLAECEAMAVASSTMTTVTTSTTTPVNAQKPEPRLRPLRTETPSTPPPPPRLPPTDRGSGDEADRAAKAAVPCKFYGKTYKGCARGTRCPFKHSWEGNEKEKNGRCWTCGGKGHPTKECHTKKTGSPTAGTPKSTAPKPPTTGPSTAPTTTQGTTNKTVRIDEIPQVEHISSSSSQPTSSNDPPIDIKEMLADVGKMLKSMSAGSLKRISVLEMGFEEKLKAVEASMRTSMIHKETTTNGLLDSGASHAMRSASEEEYTSGHPVSVTLAGEDVRVLRQNLQGTVLVKNDEGQQVQPIVPLGPVIEDLGCSLKWKKGSLQLYHPQRGYLKVKLINNCPEIQASDANALIKELEAKHLCKLNEQVEKLSARLEVMRKEEMKSWHELFSDYMTSGSQATLLKVVLTCPFTKDLPEDVQAMLVEGFSPDCGADYLKELPLTRRQRRALMTSSQWVVHIVDKQKADDDDPFNVISKAGKMVLEVNARSSKLWNLTRKNGAYQMLLWATSKGKIADIIYEPPHSTWPTSRRNHPDPDLYALRTTTEPYGKAGLPPLQQQRVNEETAGIARVFLLWMAAMVKGKGQVGFLMEFPQDEERLRELDSPRASLWETESWKSFKSISSMSTAAFYMGAYGHRSTRPTKVATNYPDLIQMNGNYDFGEQCVPQSLVDEQTMDQWSRKFKSIVAGSILNYHDNSFAFEEELKQAGVRIGKLTRGQKEEWRRHLDNDHQPYRSDCSVCINAQANGYKHRRVKHPSLYTVAFDLAGPYKQKGRSLDRDDYKYIMVAAYRCPKQYLCAMGMSDYEKEMYVPEEEEEDDLMALEPGKEPLSSDDPEEVEEEMIDDVEKILPAEDKLAFEREVEDLTKPPEVATIYITRALPRRTTSEVLLGAKDILLQLRQTGLHVSSVHTDRAREFNSKVFRTWIMDNELKHTRTAGGDPSGNSTAELGIKWAKARVRALLKGCEAEPRDWPMAIHHASASWWSKVFPHSPWTRPPATTFGNEVWFRAKAYKGSQEKKYEAVGSRWKRGWYRGPAADVSKGHLIVREDGGLTIAKSVKYNVIDPVSLQGLLPPGEASGVPHHESDDKPQSRVELKNEIEYISQRLLREENFDTKEVLKLYDKLEELGDTDLRIGKKTCVSSWFTGAFVHGGKAGLRANVKLYPNTTRYLAAFGRKVSGGRTFSAVGIARNANLGIHRDVHNYKSSRNMILPLTEFSGGGLWLQGASDKEGKSESRQLSNGTVVEGKIRELRQGELLDFAPDQWHEVQPWEGDRVIFLMYTPRATKLEGHHVQDLEETGFVIDYNSLKASVEEVGEWDEEEPGPHDARVRRSYVAKDSGKDTTFVELEDDYDSFWEGPTKVGLPRPISELSKKDQMTAKLMKMMKKAEIQYTPDIEQVIQELENQGKSLEVTHTVSLKEVKQNLQKWVESAKKEFTNLKDNKRAFVIKKQHELPKGCRIVPCKGVYTVKPDKSPQGYRRKTRFVACGNHVPEEDSCFDLFAAGLDASSLRTMLAFTAGKPWTTATTDIRQAFVLAPWLGHPVALSPPSIAYELGIAEPGDYWLVQMSIYGLRESPALWSSFRDDQLRAARWETEVDREMVTLKLQQLISDDQVWKIVRASSPEKEPLGYLMVYIDDLLITGLDPVVKSFFSWVEAKWECDSLNILDTQNPIRFLGMELHKRKDGFEIAQEGFINELLRAHQHGGGRSKTQGPRETLLLSEEEEQALLSAETVHLQGREQEVKEAQRRVGEMLWLSSRSRPDVMYVTSLMASKITKSPDLVNRIGERLLDYLCETKGYRLKFVGTDKWTLDVYTDSSFAPSGGKSQGCAGVFFGGNAITWRSSRQQLMTLSTCESELLEAVDGILLGLSTKGLIQELCQEDLPVNTLVDNTAAVTLLTTPSGSWRTRHLKLRYNWIKERMSTKEVLVSHVSGEFQHADLGTKPMTRDRMKHLISLWGMVDYADDTKVSVKATTIHQSWLKRLMMFCQVCGTAAQKDHLSAEIPWDLYVAILVLGIAVIGIWEGMKHCGRQRQARLRALRVKADKADKKLTKTELKELQRLLAVSYADLGIRAAIKWRSAESTDPSECTCCLWTFVKLYVAAVWL